MKFDINFSAKTTAHNWNRAINLIRLSINTCNNPFFQWHLMSMSCELAASLETGKRKASNWSTVRSLWLEVAAAFAAAVAVNSPNSRDPRECDSNGDDWDCKCRMDWRGNCWLRLARAARTDQRVLAGCVTMRNAKFDFYCYIEHSNDCFWARENYSLSVLDLAINWTWFFFSCTHVRHHRFTDNSCWFSLNFHFSLDTKKAPNEATREMFSDYSS